MPIGHRHFARLPDQAVLDDERMLQLSLAIPTDLTDDVVIVLSTEDAVSSIAVVRGASIEPRGDLVYADVAREHANVVIARLRSLGVAQEGTLRITSVDTWLSKAGLDAAERAPGSGADAVIWPEVGARAYAESELNGTYLIFMVLATMIAAIAIVLDSQVLVIGAMVLGPEFGPIAALGLALVLRRRALFGFALRTLRARFRGLDRRGHPRCTGDPPGRVGGTGNDPRRPSRHRLHLPPRLAGRSPWP